MIGHRRVDASWDSVGWMGETEDKSWEIAIKFLFSSHGATRQQLDKLYHILFICPATDIGRVIIKACEFHLPSW